ncbi:hypothetical protein [Polaromonas sp. CG_9.5]|uniref:hypothetical protein n=1 Tax=Polaromonas sp. CG_9.5 TaxID=3071705 RepID=UPI002E133AA6
MERIVTDETLDGLAEDDPAAMRSRRDLQRIHRVMGTRSILVKALRGLSASRPQGVPLRVLELGAGDGSLMLGVAQALKGEWPAVELTLLDRQRLVTRETLARYASLGWVARSEVVDVFDWAASPSTAANGLLQPGKSGHCDVIVTNLFLHHFEGPALAQLLAAIASRTGRFFACEPHRARLALAGSHLIGAIGANAVTREDAVLSVRAGFRDQEISTLWPPLEAGWTLQEYSAGLFSHCFRAEKNETFKGKGTKQ